MDESDPIIYHGGVGGWISRLPDGGHRFAGDGHWQRNLGLWIIGILGLLVLEFAIPHEHNSPVYKEAGWTGEHRHSERELRLMKQHQEWHEHDGE